MINSVKKLLRKNDVRARYDSANALWGQIIPLDNNGVAKSLPSAKEIERWLSRNAIEFYTWSDENNEPDTILGEEVMVMAGFTRLTDNYSDLGRRNLEVARHIFDAFSSRRLCYPGSLAEALRLRLGF